MKKILTLLVFTIAFMAGCSEDELTPGEITGKKISAVVKKERIEVAYVYMNDQTYLNQSNVPFRIEGSFLVTFSPNPTYYDLNKLISFKPYGNDIRRIDFYFE